MDNELREATTLLREGNRIEANRLLRQVIKENPGDDKAWVLLARTMTDKEKQERCLAEALKANPHNAEARRGLASLRLADLEETPASVQYLEQKAKRWYFAPEVKWLTFLFCLPLWSLIILDDPKGQGWLKAVAGVVLLVFVLAACIYFSG